MDIIFGTRLKDWNWEVIKEGIKDDSDILYNWLMRLLIEKSLKTGR